MLITEADMRHLVIRIAALTLVGGLTPAAAAADSIAMTVGFLQVSRPSAGVKHLGALPLPNAPGLAYSAFSGRRSSLHGPAGCLVGCVAGGSVDLGILSSASGDRRTVTPGGMPFSPMAGFSGRSSSNSGGLRVVFASTAKLPSLLKPSNKHSGKSGKRGQGNQGKKKTLLDRPTIFLPDVIDPGPGVRGPGQGGLQGDTAGPEPATMLLLGAGLGAVMLNRARRHTRTRDR
jgi:hypothetical protein